MYCDEFLEYTRKKSLRPDSDVSVASFMRYAITDRPRKLGRTTVCQTIPAGVNDYFQFRPEISPTNSALVKQMKKAVERSTVKGNQDRQPLTVKMLQSMANQVCATVESTRNICLVLLMTFGMLRESEAVRLLTSDVQHEVRDGKSSLSLFIRKSKMDQSSDGATILISALDSGICPVKWYFVFQKLRHPQAVYLFHRIGPRVDIQSPLASSTPNFIV